MPTTITAAARNSTLHPATIASCRAATAYIASTVDDAIRCTADVVQGLPGAERRRRAQHDRRRAAVEGVHGAEDEKHAQARHRAQDRLPVPGEGRPASASSVGQVLPWPRGAVLHLRAR